MDTPATPSTYNLECPLSIKWTISEEKLAALKDSNTNGFLKTEWFDASNLPGVKYYLDIFPNGNEEGRREQAWIFLNLGIGNEKIIKCNVKFSVESAGFTKEENYEYEETYGYGLNLSETAELFDPAKKFFVHGKLTLKCEGILSVQREKLAENGNGINFGDGNIGHKLWKNDDNKDFIIKVGEDFIKAHKYVLAAQSPVFEAMFHHSGMKETTENQTDITDFSFKVVETAIQLCYNVGTIDALNLEEKMGLLQFFDKYEMLSLMTICEASLVKDVSASNVCQLANCSIISNAFKLQEKCAELLTQCIKAGTPVANFDILEKDYICKIFSNVCCNTTET